MSWDEVQDSIGKISVGIRDSVGGEEAASLRNATFPP